MTEFKSHTKIVVGVIVVVLGLVNVILFTSFSAVEYYQMGFMKKKSTGSVNTLTVYDMGKYFLGPDKTIKIFPADIHFEQMSDVAIFTSDRLEVWVTCAYQYILRKEDLDLLHDDYDLDYADIIRSNALDALKVAATSYSTNEFIKDRAFVEDALFKAVRERLGGVCCGTDCKETDTCRAGCKHQSECLDTDKGLFASARYFQMQTLDIPPDVGDRYLRALVLQEETEKASFVQEAAIVERKTDAMVDEINNDVKEISQNATAYANLLLARAEANSTATIERARTEGLKNLYVNLGLTSEDYMNSFDYLRTIKGMDNAHLSVEFDQLIAGPYAP